MLLDVNRSACQTRARRCRRRRQPPDTKPSLEIKHNCCVVKVNVNLVNLEEGENAFVTSFSV